MSYTAVCNPGCITSATCVEKARQVVLDLNYPAELHMDLSGETDDGKAQLAQTVQGLVFAVKLEPATHRKLASWLNW